MANPTDKKIDTPLFREMEYVFTKYYNETIAPVVSQQQRVLRQNQVRETRERSDSGWGGYIDAASPFATQLVALETGPWNKASTEKLLSMIRQQLESKGFKHDLQVMTEAWRIAAKKELGEENYNRLSAGCPHGDLAYDFVHNRIETMMLQQLGKSKVPKSSLEYIIKQGFDGSIWGFLMPTIRSKTDMDSKLEKTINASYSPTGLERIGAHLVSFAGDAVALPIGYNSALRAAGLLVADVSLRFGSDALEDSSLDEQLGSAFFDDKTAWKQMQADAKKVKPSGSALINLVNQNLTNKMKVPAYRPPYSNDEEKLMRKQLLDAAQGDTSTHLSNVFNSLQSEGITVKTDSSVPAWMMQKNPEEALRYSATFTAMAIEMKRTGKSVMKFGDKNMSFADVAQRGYDYARAADQMKRQARKPQMQDTAASTQQAPSQSPVQSQQQYAQAQYQQQVQQQYQQGQPMPQQPMQQAVNYQQTGMSGWDSLMSQFGLTGMSDIGKNLGYVLAMLPDMLIGMLTGQSKSLRLKDNLLPFGAIFAGMFVRNPFLKMLLIGLGGANILNKAGHEILDNAGVKTTQQRPKQYVQHRDEILSERIEQPAMKGNALVATIDHKPCVIYVDEQTADAYYQGKLPLNTLCNAVLRKYDEQQSAVRDQYERGVVQGQEQQRTLGLK